MTSVEEPTSGGRAAIIPHLIVRDAERALAFYRDAFGAKETYRLAAPGGGALLRAEFTIGGAAVSLCDEFPDLGVVSPQSLGGSPVVIHLGVDDVDATFGRAVAAGATGLMPPADLSWGERYARLVDPFGHSWALVGPIDEPSPEEGRARAAGGDWEAPYSN